MKKDTIAAIATAMSDSGIGIVRISGEEAIGVADRIFRSKKGKKKLADVASHTVHYGMVYDGEEMIDEVLVLVLRGPHSYTAEDTVEIDCHGGVLVMKRILETVLRNGARAAEAGEFTKRAFLNGRMDLAQAEAVMNLIQAKNEYALQASVSQLRGTVSQKIRRLREEILYQIAYIESALDDPEHISLDGYAQTLLGVLEPMLEELKKMIDSADDGKIMTEGIRTVILGKPNAGKSSLMNVLVGEERAIVTEIAGTTRDTVEEQIRLRGMNLHIIDTAGIRDTEDIVEKIGVNKAREAAKDADLIIYVVDGSCALDDNDREIVKLIRDRKALVLLNKSDLAVVVSQEELEEMSGHKVLAISAKENLGIEKLEEAIAAMFYRGEIDFNQEIYITNARHKAALEESRQSLLMTKQSIEDGMPEDFFSIDLMNAYEQLGSIIGEALEDDLVNEIFQKFCMGK
ncbi:MAG: tRNA uridine-5-carboxymethylaminomethyl(34) synthesis GTPase MnmE [bacterium]|nr:tRNA uridine-5-carboxymethylaminomethyl(34) synthesis GTPase MnmE [bacterium]